MPQVTAGIGFKVSGFEPSHDLAWHFAGEAGRRRFWSAVAKLAAPIYDRQLAAGIGKGGAPLRAITERTRRHRRSAMGPADPGAPPLTPAHALSRTRSYVRTRVLDDGVWFYWIYDSRVGDTWGVILGYQAKAGRDVFGLSPQSAKQVKAEALKWWQANRERLGANVLTAGANLSGQPHQGFTSRVPQSMQAPSPLEATPLIRIFHGTYATGHAPGSGTTHHPGGVIGYDFGKEGLTFGNFGPLKPTGPPKPTGLPRPNPPGAPGRIMPAPAPVRQNPVGAALDFAGIAKHPERAAIVVDGVKTPRMTMAHEVGHLLDKEAIPGGRPVGAHRVFFADAQFREWVEAVKDTDEYKRLLAMQAVAEDPARVQYLEYALRWRELWARSYAQYIASKGRSRAMRAELDELRKAPVTGPYYPVQWGDEAFAPIASAIDNLFRALQWV